MHRWLVPLPAALLLLVPVAGRGPDNAKTPAGAWTHWRGPTGQGHVNDEKAPLSWNETKNVVWKTRLTGGGNSSPIVWGDRIFLTAASAGGAERFVMCVRATDGKLLWQQTAITDVPLERTHVMNGYASASCAVDGSHVVAFFGTPTFCYDFDGKLLWKKNFGVFTSNQGWGTAATPFIYEDTVIFNCDNDGGPGSATAALVALETHTGAPRWSTPRDHGRGFSTPRLFKAAGGRVDLLLNGPRGVWGYDPKTGKEQWHCDRTDAGDKARFGEPIPVDDGERLFVSSGRPGPFQILKLPGTGNVTSTHVLHAGVRKGHRDVSSPILWKGKVYAADLKGVLSCIDLGTGKELYSGYIGNRSNQSLASPISLRGQLLWLMDDGTTVVVEPGDALKIVGRNKLGEGKKLDFGASPAVVNGRIYLRSQSHLYCIAEKQ